MFALVVVQTGSNEQIPVSGGKQNYYHYSYTLPIQNSMFHISQRPVGALARLSVLWNS